jgi:PAS domain S-box-containing protein
MILGSNMMADDSGEGRLGDFCTIEGLTQLLSLTSDGIVCTGRDGRIVVANEQFAEMCGVSRLKLLGTDLSTLLMTLEGLPATDIVHEKADTTVTRTLLLRHPSSGDALPVFVRVGRLRDSGSYVVSLALSQSAEREKAATELDAFLGDAGEGFEKADTVSLIDTSMLEMQQAVGADGALLYVFDKDGYRLRARTDGFSDVAAPAYLPDSEFVNAVMTSPRNTRCLVVDDPRAFGPGTSGRGPATDADTGETYDLRRGLMPRLKCLYVVPIRYGSMLVGMMVVGWRDAVRTNPRDNRVLDIISKHVAAEIVTALSAIKTARVENLQEAASAMREQIAEGAKPAQEIDAAFRSLAETLGCSYLPVYVNDHQHVRLLETPDGEHLEFPFDIDAVCEGRHSDGVAVVPLRMGGDIALWLAQRDLPSRGALVDAGVMGDVRRVFLVVRSSDSEPLEDTDCMLLEHFVQDVRGVTKDEKDRTRSSFIAQSLMGGMSNHVQKVDGLVCDHIYNSATETASVGGDFYDLIRLPDRRACIILGDVAGKGVQSASVSSAVRTALGAYAWEGLMPAHMVRSLNDFFMGFSRLETFATLFVGIADLKNATLTYCSAGHPPALLVRRNQNAVELLNVQSGVVGAFREMTYRDGRVALEEGDTLLLYTDGVTEARAKSGEFFGETGLRECVVDWMGKGDDRLPDHILGSILSFTGGVMDDDVAMMAVRFEKLGAARRARARAGKGR